MTTLVNIRKVKGKPKPKYDVLIDRRTIFGNPHPIGYCNICKRIHDRKDCVNEYKKDFYHKINSDPEFKRKVLELKDKILACWCTPLLCHGNVIIEYLENCNITKEEFDELPSNGVFTCPQCGSKQTHPYPDCGCPPNKDGDGINHINKYHHICSVVANLLIKDIIRKEKECRRKFNLT